MCVARTNVRVYLLIPGSSAILLFLRGTLLITLIEVYEG